MPNDNEFTSAEAGAPVHNCPESRLAQQPKPHWIEIELVGEDDSPVPEEEYEIKLPDGTLVKGYLDEKGWARVDGIEQPGQCEVSFPRLDREAWKPDGGTLPSRQNNTYSAN